MNVVDIVIIIFLLMFGIVGAQRGFFKEFVLCVGTIAVFVLAYQLKDFVGNFLLLKMPMFDFPNMFEGVITLNILVYQLLGFVIALAILLIIFNLIVGLTGLLEKVLKLTIILAIPSKILGFVLGAIEGYVIAFVILFFLTQPAFSFDIFVNSKLSNTILQSSPVLTSVTKDTIQLVEDIYELKDEKDKDVINSKVLDMMLDKKIVDYKTANQLYQDNKIKFDGIDEVLNKHKGDK